MRSVGRGVRGRSRGGAVGCDGRCRGRLGGRRSDGRRVRRRRRIRGRSGSRIRRRRRRRRGIGSRSGIGRRIRRRRRIRRGRRIGRGRWIGRRRGIWRRRVRVVEHADRGADREHQRRPVARGDARATADDRSGALLRLTPGRRPAVAGGVELDRRTNREPVGNGRRRHTCGRRRRCGPRRADPCGHDRLPAFGGGAGTPRGEDRDVKSLGAAGRRRRCAAALGGPDVAGRRHLRTESGPRHEADPRHRHAVRLRRELDANHVRPGDLRPCAELEDRALQHGRSGADHRACRGQPGGSKQGVGSRGGHRHRHPRGGPTRVSAAAVENLSEMDIPCR